MFALAAMSRIVESMKTSEVRHYATPGLSSFLVGAPGADGGCVRLFSSDRDTREWITPHSHRFNFACLVLAGEVWNILFKPTFSGGDAYGIGELRPVDGGLGKYEAHRTEKRNTFAELLYHYEEGDTYSMEADEIHSIRFSRGARVLFFEGPPIRETSVFLEPFSNGELVRTFDTKPWMFKQGGAP